MKETKLARRGRVISAGGSLWAASVLLSACTSSPGPDATVLDAADAAEPASTPRDRDGGATTPPRSDRDATAGGVIDGTDAASPRDAGPPRGEPDAYVGPVSAEGAPLYPGDARHSPITSSVAANLTKIVASNTSSDKHNFIRLGDNLSHQSILLGCMDPASKKTAKLADLSSAKPTVDYFLTGRIDGKSPFLYEIDLESLVPNDIVDAKSGPHYLEDQVAKAHPVFALVSFGPVGHAGASDPNHDDWWIIINNGPPMLEIADRLIARGVIPLFRSIAPYYGRPGPNMLVPLANAVSRGIAQGRQLPYADAYLDTVSLGAEAYGADGAHLSTYNDNPCDLSEVARQKAAANAVNYIALQQLDRAKRVAIDREAPPDASAATLDGKGTRESPYIAHKLPFAHLRELAASGTKVDYSKCGGDKNEAAGEVVFEYDAASTVTLRAYVFDRMGSAADTTVHHFVGDLDHCASSHDTLLQLSLAPGKHFFVVDATLGKASNVPLEFGFGLVPCASGDPTCVSDVK